MKISPLHHQWNLARRELKLRHSHDIVKAFLERDRQAEVLTRQGGIREEYDAVEDAFTNGNWSPISEKREIRYGETAYLIWALGVELGRYDLLEANIENWDHGTDEGGGSNFRNLEYEAHVALRFLEEGFDVQPLDGEGKAEMLVDGEFVIECKRPTKWIGLFTNVLKARKQITSSGYPGFVVFNVDNIDDYEFQLDSDEDIEASFQKLSDAAEHGMGGLDSPVLGVVVDYLPPRLSSAREGALTHTVHNCTGRSLLEKQDLFKKLSVGLTGDLSLFNDLRSPAVEVSNRYPGGQDSDSKAVRDLHFETSIDI